MIDILRSRFAEPLSYLDIGSGGESPLPTYLLRRSNWNVQCIDKFDWVRRQEAYAARVSGGREPGRFAVQVQDLLTADLPQEAYDIITNISVIEHFAGTSDSDAMARSARLLKPGGTYILTTLVNDGFFKEHFVQQDVYGEAFSSEPVFYQRHYDVAALPAAPHRTVGIAGNPPCLLRRLRIPVLRARTAAQITRTTQAVACIV